MTGVQTCLPILRKLLKETFPDDDIQARNVKDTITLSGSVNSKDTSERATALAASFAKAVVNNLAIKSGPVEKQVLLRVKFALLDRSKAAHFGINLSGTDTPTKSSPLHVGPFNTDASISTGSIPLTDAAFNLRRLDLNLQALIKA